MISIISIYRIVLLVTIIPSTLGLIRSKRTDESISGESKMKKRRKNDSETISARVSYPNYQLNNYSWSIWSKRIDKKKNRRSLKKNRSLDAATNDEISTSS